MRAPSPIGFGNNAWKLAVGRALYGPNDPMGKMFFNILATFAEFETDLIRMRTREGMAIARAQGKLRGKQPKLSGRQQRELCRMHATGEYSISDLAELFSVSRPTVYRTLNRHLALAYDPALTGIDPGTISSAYPWFCHRRPTRRERR